jgi:NADP oxidoreductase coenzyme F420-dependent
VRGNVHSARVNEAAAGAEVVALTVPWPAAQDALRSAEDPGGKILLDCTNPLKPDRSGLTVGYTAIWRQICCLPQLGGRLRDRSDLLGQDLKRPLEMW